jgi:hypothetical protein
LPGAVVGYVAAALAIDVLKNFEELSPVAAALRDWIGPADFGHLLDAFFLPLALIWTGVRVAPSAKRIVTVVLAGVYVAYNVWRFAQLGQSGVTLESLSGDASFLVALAVLQILGVGAGVYLAAFRKQTVSASAGP